ncbi:hypothetical protein ACQY0O_002617 [Thecaphora frezii]
MSSSNGGTGDLNGNASNFGDDSGAQLHHDRTHFGSGLGKTVAEAPGSVQDAGNLAVCSVESHRSADGASGPKQAGDTPPEQPRRSNSAEPHAGATAAPSQPPAPAAVPASAASEASAAAPAAAAVAPLLAASPAPNIVERSGAEDDAQGLTQSGDTSAASTGAAQAPSETVATHGFPPGPSAGAPIEIDQHAATEPAAVPTRPTAVPLAADPDAAMGVEAAGASGDPPLRPSGTDTNNSFRSASTAPTTVPLATSTKTASIFAAETGPAEASSVAAGQSSGTRNGDAPSTSAAPPPRPGLPKKIAEELRGIHAAAATIANFTAVHINRGVMPRATDVQASVNRALSITQVLTSLLSSSDVLSAPSDEQARGLYDFSIPSTPSRGGPLSTLATYSPYELSAFSSGRKRGGGAKQGGAARKRRRSGDGKSDTKAEAGAAAASKDAAAGEAEQNGQAQSQAGVADAPSTPGKTSRPDASGASAASLAGEGVEVKGPVYKKRSRAHASGSCASCNTVDTPEWRRGPDGARTLCNACGLHYAKLVRNRQRAMQQELPEGGIPLVPPPPVTIEELRASTKANNIGGSAPSTSIASSRPAAVSGTPSRPGSGERVLAAPATLVRGDDVERFQLATRLPLLARIAEPLAALALASASSSGSDVMITPQLRYQVSSERPGSSDAPASTIAIADATTTAAASGATVATTTAETRPSTALAEAPVVSTQGPTDQVLPRSDVAQSSAPVAAPASTPTPAFWADESKTAVEVGPHPHANGHRAVEAAPQAPQTTKVEPCTEPQGEPHTLPQQLQPAPQAGKTDEDRPMDEA